MGLQAKTAFRGLVTATGEVTADQGALRVADNVTLRKEGALTLRQHFTSSALSRAYLAAFPYKGSLYYVGAGNVYYMPGQLGPMQVTYEGAQITPTPVRADIQTVKEARGNLYFPTAEGVYKNSAPTDGFLLSSGANPTATVIGSTINPGTPELLQVGQRVAYRVVTVQTDPNGVVRRSRPSGAVVINTASVAGSPFLVVAYDAYTTPSLAATTRTVEVYRTRVFPQTATVDDEMQLVYTFSAPPNTASTFTFEDKVADAARGLTLYTSPSRGGIEAANDRPPGCAVLERFRGSLFFGNTVGPHRFTLSYRPSSANLVGSATGVGVRRTTGNVTAGGNTVTSIANTTGLQVGMFVALISGANLGQITNLAGTTATVTGPIPYSETGGQINFTDAVLINGTAVALGGGASAFRTTSGWHQMYSATLRPDYIIYELSPAAAGYDQTIVVERIRRSGAAFTVSATHGDEMSPAVPLPSSGTTSPSKNDALPHGLAWSEPDEPEHVPIKNTARVGDAGKAILALVATKDRLLIMKEDGVYMLTGNTARDFAIYPLDTTCLCILPGSVRRLQNTVYFLSNLGLVAIDEGGGAQIVSRPIQTELAPIITAIRQAQKASGLYLMPGLAGVTGTSDDANGEYWLALGSTTPSFFGQVLVWNLFQSGFTTYSFGTPAPVALAADGEGQPLVLTASSLLTPTTTRGAITARISPRAFSDPALTGKLWTHIVAGFSQLTGTASVTARFSSSESMVSGTEVVEVMEAPTAAGLVQLPGGSLMRHPMPRAMARAYLAFVELVIAVTDGTFTLDLVGAESRENIPNKRPTHGTGAT